MICSSGCGRDEPAQYNVRVLMRPRILFLLALLTFFARQSEAQEPPPRIPLFVVDVHGTAPQFPDDPTLAASRGMSLGELPGTGLGVQLGLHMYPLRWKAITFGVGGELAASRARQTPADGVAGVRPAKERFTSIAPQLSFNFGTGKGWSYISGGIGQSTWAVTPEGQDGFPADSEPLKTINYGGGARWFMKTHLAFSFDVRVYAINPGTPIFGLPGSPRTALLVIGAGASFK
jgi:hypothetical protein